MLCSENHCFLLPHLPNFSRFHLNQRILFPETFYLSFFLTLFLSIVPHLVLHRRLHTSLGLLVLRWTEISKTKKKKHMHPTLTCSPSPATASCFAVWITSGCLIHPHSSSLNLEQIFVPFLDNVWEISSSLFFFLKTNCALLLVLWTWFGEEWTSPAPEDLAKPPSKMKQLTCFLIWLFVSEARAFEIPTSGLPEVSTSRRPLAVGLYLCSVSSLLLFKDCILCGMESYDTIHLSRSVHCYTCWNMYLPFKALMGFA